jgi:hypothetical protein
LIVTQPAQLPFDFFGTVFPGRLATIGLLWKLNPSTL